jgi:hypothetical protein
VVFPPAWHAIDVCWKAEGLMRDEAWPIVPVGKDMLAGVCDVRCNYLVGCNPRATRIAWPSRTPANGPELIPLSVLSGPHLSLCYLLNTCPPNVCTEYRHALKHVVAATSWWSPL